MKPDFFPFFFLIQQILFAPPGSAAVNTSVCAFVGTPPCLYQPCNLRWRQGPFQLVEEPLTAGQVALIAALGPEYIGSLQAPPAPPGMRLSSSKIGLILGLSRDSFFFFNFKGFFACFAR